MLTVLANVCCRGLQGSASRVSATVAASGGGHRRRGVVDLADIDLDNGNTIQALNAEPRTYGAVHPSLPADFIPLVLEKRRWVSPDSALLTFALPSVSLYLPSTS
jgi:hypothetical protein